MRITVLGSGTSGGVPEVTCKCDTCLSTDPKDKRMRASIFIEVNGKKYTKSKLNRKKGTKTWTITLKAKKVGKTKVKVIAYNSKKIASKTITKTLKVIAKRNTKKKGAK